MFDYRVEDFELVRFFSYTSIISPISSSSTFYLGYRDAEAYPCITKKFDDFYAALGEKATNLVGKYKYFWFHDNKTVFQIRHKFSGKIYFIGRYDFNRAIGKSCYLYFGKIFDFKTMKETDFLENIKAEENSLWKRIEM